MTKQELEKIYQRLKREIETRKKHLDVLIETFGWDATEVFIVKNEIKLLESMLTEED